VEQVIDYILSFKQLCRIEEEIAGRLPLTAREATLVCALAESDSPRAGELARLVGLSPSRLSRLLAGLKRKGMVDWREDDRDRRAVDVALTTEGRAACAEIKKAKSACERRLRSRLTPAELALIKKSLALLIQTL
jgi:DNA-binding MarR family transcriptional regulator